MQNIDDLLKQQRDLIIQMDHQHQRQLNSLHERISRVEAQIQSFHQNTENNNGNGGNQIQLSKNSLNQRSNIEITKNSLAHNQTFTPPSASQEKLPKLNSSFPR